MIACHHGSNLCWIFAGKECTARGMDLSAATSALEGLFQAHAAVEVANEAVHDVPKEELVAAIQGEFKKAHALEDHDEASLRFVALAEVLAELEGPEVVEMLIDVLDLEDSDARQVAGEALVGLASDRFAEVAHVVEKQLATRPASSTALRELTYVFAMIPDASSVKLLEKFLAHSEAAVVASAIEALVEIGDAAASRALHKLKNDKRQVSIEDDRDGDETVTIGQLAIEAVNLIREASRN